MNILNKVLGIFAISSRLKKMSTETYYMRKPKFMYSGSEEIHLGCHSNVMASKYIYIYIFSM